MLNAMGLNHPAQILFAGALFAAVLRGRARRVLMVAVPAAALISLAWLDPGTSWSYPVAGYTLELLHVDALSRLFAVVFCLVAVLGMVYALHAAGPETTASLALAGASLGVVFAGDWIAMFIFWEVMSVASLFIVWMGGTPAARRAGMRYLLIHVLGGGLLFAGILLHLAGGGDARFGPLTGGPLTPAGWLILTGVAVNAAIPPLHTWLTDAYPECSVTGSVVQSAFTTKTAVFVLLRAFPGLELLAVLGAVMAVYGVLYAVLENDIRRLLAYHIVSQVGFMVAGVGLGSPLALDGAAAHAFCHILYKALLFMGAGAVITATGKSKLTDLGGLAPKMKAVLALFMVGALSISGLPLLNGFISKSMTIAAFADAHRPVLHTLLELASVGTFLSIGLKLTYFAFFGEDRKLSCKAIPPNMYAAMGATGALCLILGLPGLTWMLYDLLPNRTGYAPYTVGHVTSAIQLHVGTAAGFWLLLGLLGVKPSIQLDFDWFYRKPFAAAFDALVRVLKAWGTFLQEGTARALTNSLPGYYDVDNRRPPVGASLFWIALFFSILAVYVFRRFAIVL